MKWKEGEIEWANQTNTLLGKGKDVLRDGVLAYRVLNNGSRTEGIVTELLVILCEPCKSCKGVLNCKKGTSQESESRTDFDGWDLQWATCKCLR